MPLATYRADGRIGYLGLNRPEKLNAISPDMLADFHRALDEFIADEQTRVGILYGEGRAFCVGMDLGGGGQYQSHHSVADDHTRLAGIARGWLRLWDCPKPIIAQIHGYAFASGTQIPICCDIVAIADDATLGWPKLPVGGGLISPMWNTVVGVQRAKLMSYRVGSTMTAAEAHALGYAALIYPAADLAREVTALAAEIAKVPADLLRLKKAANNRVAEARGFREAVLDGAEWDAIAHTTSAVDTARAWIAEHGLAGAIEKFQHDGM